MEDIYMIYGGLVVLFLLLSPYIVYDVLELHDE